MNSQNCKICEVCYDSFISDPRIGDRQKVCKKFSCKNEQKRRSQKEWLKKNKDYFKGRYPYVKEWQRQNPGYLKKYRKKKREQATSDIQDKLTSKKTTRSFSVTDIQDELSSINTEHNDFLHMAGVIYKTSELLINTMLNST